MPARRALLACFAALPLAACGFQLRGQVTLPFQTVYVDGLPYSALNGQLKRGIQSNGTAVSEKAEGAQAIVSLLNEAQERGILAVSAGGRVRELQLRYRVKFKVVDPKGRNWLEPTEIVVQRDMTYDDTQILAKEGEAQMLFREMQTDAVQQVLRRIQAIRAMSEEPA